MGATYVDVTVRNPAEPERAWRGRFLVDTGASHSLVPRKHLDAIGVKPNERREGELADGSIQMFDMGPARLEFMGRITAGAVVFVDDETEPLLGFIALEDAQMEVDPFAGRLKPHARPRFKYGLRAFFRPQPEAQQPPG